MKEEDQWLGEDDQGDMRTPGPRATKMWAGVKRVPNGQFELHVRFIWGSIEGSFEEDGREMRRYRADTLDALLRIGISELKGDDTFVSPRFAQAVRNAIYEAQDAEVDLDQLAAYLSTAAAAGAK